MDLAMSDLDYLRKSPDMDFLRKSPSMPTMERLSPFPLMKRSMSEPSLRRNLLAVGVALERSSSVFFAPSGPAGGSSSLRVATFNCMCTALGTGILAIPHVLTEVGLLGGILLLGALWLLTERSAAFLMTAAELTGEGLYTEIAAAAFGPAVGQATGVILVLYCFGSCVGGLVVIKQVVACRSHHTSPRHSTGQADGGLLGAAGRPPPDLLRAAQGD